MLKVKKSLYELLKGGFLIDESSFKNWMLRYSAIRLVDLGAFK